MEYFPFYMKTANKVFLVIGGRELALRKVKVISQYKTKIHVVAKEIGSELSKYIESHKETIEAEIRGYKDKDLDYADYVIVATRDQGLNHWIAKSCKERRIPVNVAEDEEESSFIMPAVIHGENLDIAISSGGKSPAAVAYLKKRLSNQIPDHFESLIGELGHYRKYVKEKVTDYRLREEAFECLLSIGLVNDCVLPKEVVEDVVRHLMSENQ